MSGFDKEMQDALRADAEKLRAMGADVADPVFLETGPQERGHGATTGSHHNTRPAEGSPEELIWLRGYEAGVIDMRSDGEATKWQPLPPPPGEEDGGDLNLMKLGFDEVVRHKDDQLEALRAENAELKRLITHMVEAIGKGALDSEEIVPVPGDGPPYRFHEEWAHHARSALLPKENEDDE